ncbi:hypothetical protein Acr_24g0004300 [Actinidia rufa]|uniref:Uncharacterized protein n=1 Tax=Actinidia rufa TaxID=165716 RepID=A0A7J0GTS6_9ERIC|nr:hypothetical protein Acr_24g0004300 [Actinidia rufa]
MHVSSEACNSNSDNSAALPIYSMQTTKLPLGLCDDIENVNMTFLWGGIKQKKDFILSIGKKFNYREEGGLGIRRIRETSTALLEKIGWRLLKERDSLWAKVLRAKYLVTAQQPWNAQHRGSPYVWKSIVQTNQITRSVYRWKVENGRSIGFSADPWLYDIPLADMVEGRITQDEWGAKVKIYWLDSGKSTIHAIRDCEVPRQLWKESSQDTEIGWFLWKFASRLVGLQHEVGHGQRHGRTQLDNRFLSSFRATQKRQQHQGWSETIMGSGYWVSELMLDGQPRLRQNYRAYGRREKPGSDEECQFQHVWGVSIPASLERSQQECRPDGSFLGAEWGNV